MINNKVQITRTYIKNNILNNRTFAGHEQEKNQIFDLLLQTVEAGESNSALLIGPRGVGKTTLINTVLEDLQEHETFRENALAVRLHGLIHTDNRIALKGITSQLNLDYAVDGKVFGSYAENLTYLLACLKSGQKESTKNIIFILEEFDLFCAHHNQTLLYNLFDVSQSAQTPLCIIGTTCRLDVIELLEKRVKSRFSHRQIFLFPRQADVNTCVLKIENLLTLSSKAKSDLPASYKQEWNQSIKDLINSKNVKFLIQRLLDIDSSEQTFKNFLIVIVSSLNNEKRFLKLGDFQEALAALEKDETVEAVQDLSVLELCLLIAMKHHCEIHENQAMNFEMVLTRYLKFANSNSNIQSIQSPVLMKAFEHLQNMELIAPVSACSGRLQKEYQMFKLLVTPQQILEGIKKSQGIPTEVVQWANSSIV